MLSNDNACRSIEQNMRMFYHGGKKNKQKIYLEKQRSDLWGAVSKAIQTTFNSNDLDYLAYHKTKTRFNFSPFY